MSMWDPLSLRTTPKHREAVPISVKTDLASACQRRASATNKLLRWELLWKGKLPTGAERVLLLHAHTPHMCGKVVENEMENGKNPTI